ncbi:MAG: hydroxymethylpyrimidine/phosphomethylpyrimidine kinase, partial [Rhodospirillaceae bacterium]
MLSPPSNGQPGDNTVTPANVQGRILICAGSDSSGGAGVQADIKTVTALGGYALTAITALTAQNTQGVSDIHMIPPAFIARQMQACLEDIGADVIKTGMLATVAVIRTVGTILATMAPLVPLVVDPVMVANGGTVLLAIEAIHALKVHLLARAALITPNLPEAAALLGQDVPLDTPEAMRTAACRLRYPRRPDDPLRPSSHRVHQYPWNRLHPGHGHRLRSGARYDPDSVGGAGASLCVQGHRHRARIRPWPRSSQPWAHDLCRVPPRGRERGEAASGRDRDRTCDPSRVKRVLSR